MIEATNPDTPAQTQMMRRHLSSPSHALSKHTLLLLYISTVLDGQIRIGAPCFVFPPGVDGQIRMIGMEIDSDILNIHFPISFQFSSKNVIFDPNVFPKFCLLNIMNLKGSSPLKLRFQLPTQFFF